MRKCLLFFFTFISIFNYSQKIKGIIKNSENKPIENARIGIENENIGDLTDSNGNFNVDFTNIDKSKKNNSFS